MSIAKTMTLEGVVSINGTNHIVYTGYIDGDGFQDCVTVPFDAKLKAVQYQQAQFIYGSDSHFVAGLNNNMYPIQAENSLALRPGTQFFCDKQWYQVENIRFSQMDFNSPTAGSIPESLTIYLKLESE